MEILQLPFLRNIPLPHNRAYCEFPKLERTQYLPRKVPKTYFLSLIYPQFCLWWFKHLAKYLW